MRLVEKHVVIDDEVKTRTISQPIFATSEEANILLKELTDICNQYGYVTICDMYDLLGISSEFTDNFYVWTDANSFKVDNVGIEYSIAFSNPVKIS